MSEVNYSLHHKSQVIIYHAGVLPSGASDTSLLGGSDTLRVFVLGGSDTLCVFVCLTYLTEK